MELHIYLHIYLPNSEMGAEKGGKKKRKNKPHVRTFYLGVAEGECRLGGRHGSSYVIHLIKMACICLPHHSSLNTTTPLLSKQTKQTGRKTKTSHNSRNRFFLANLISLVGLRSRRGGGGEQNTKGRCRCSDPTWPLVEMRMEITS